MADAAISLTGLSIDRLRSFCQIVDAGSAAIAAQRNSVLPGQLSRQIKDLETTLGVKLFVREGRNLKLTSSGTRLATLTNAFFGSLQDLKQTDGLDAKPLKLSAGDSVLRWILFPRLPEVLSAAGTAVEIGTHRTSEIVDRLERGELDVGIIRADAGGDALERLPFPTMRFVFMAPRSALPGKSAAGIHAVASLPFVMLNGDGRFVRGVEQVAKENGITLQIAVRVESFGLAIEAAKTLNAAVFVPADAEREFSIEQFTPVPLDKIRSLDRALAVAYGRKTAEFNSRARRYALRLSRAWETLGPITS